MSDNRNHLQFYADRSRTQEQTIQRLQEDNSEMRKALAYIADQNSGMWGGVAFETLRKVGRK
jgi:hypothetical protein